MTTHVPEMTLPMREYCSRQNVSFPIVVTNDVGVADCATRPTRMSESRTGTRRRDRIEAPW
jgi:hypothetical protein